MRHTHTTLAACALLTLASAARLSAQSGDEGSVGSGALVYPVDPEAMPRPVATAVRTSGVITIDGVVSEDAWGDAEILTGFIQSKPNTGYPATERSEVRILYDDEKLYIGAILYDREPDLLVAQRMEQDFMSRDEDVFGFSLDTFLDRANAYYVFTNPNGALRDAQSYDNSRTSNPEWEGVIEVAATIHDQGWSAEFAIPFTTLRFDPTLDEQVWGMNLVRRIRRRGEDALWAPVAFRTRLHKMDEAGTLVGLRGLRSGRNVTVKPFVLGGNVSGSLPGPGELGSSADGGLDMKWGITPRLTADLTWRTDFSQVEVDQEQVNLTRFSLFFPEKRDFFIESAGTYQFGDLSEREYRLGASPRDFTLFHSRRIGLEGGQPVPIVGGGRLTGHLGGTQVGLLSMQTQGTTALAAENFAVARVRRSLFGVIEVGGMAINRQTTEGPGSYNRSWGLDANARLAGNLILHSYLAGSHEPGVSGANKAARISAAWRDDFWNVSALYRSLGVNFNPGVGFVRRTGVDHTYATLGVHPRVSFASVVELNPYVETEHYRNPAGLMETRNLSAGLGALFRDGATFNVTARDRYERLDEEFVLSQGIVPAGRYGFREAELTYVASPAHVLAPTVRISGGGYFQGDRRSIGGSLIWRPNAHFAFDVGADHNVIDLTGEAFAVDVLSGRADYAYSTKLIAGTWIQYNDATGELVTNARLNYIHAPLSDLFLVYAERRDAGSGALLDRRLTAKLTKLLSF